MRLPLRVALVTSLVVVSSAATHAQLSKPSTRASVRAELPHELPVVFGARPDVARMRAEDEERRNEIAPYRYGAVVPVDVGLEREGRWDTVDATGELVWRVELASPGAYTLGLLFDEFRIPEGGEVFVYAPDGSTTLGAYTSANEQANGMLGIEPVRGDRLIVEYVQAPSASGTPRLHIESIVHDYRDVFALSAALEADPTPPQSAQRGPGCLVDINCAAGAPYQDIKRAVIGLLRGGFVCSGSILNNSAKDGTPYMLTANHCGGFTNGTFLFNYERPGCNSGSAPVTQTLSGAQLLYADGLIDSQLYLLNETPPAAFKPYYAGWSKGATQGAPAIGISHPAGLPKKIQIDYQAPFGSTDGWTVTYDLGEIQGGSSGSPLFNSFGRVLGPLCCGTANCGSSLASYGKLSRFWQRYPIGQYLDPLGTVNNGIGGYDPFSAAAVMYNGSGANPSVYSSTVPAMGSNWIGTVDVSMHPGATASVILGRTGMSTGSFFAFGELLIDLSSSYVFESFAGVSGSTSTHSASIPTDPMLTGTVVFSQAVILGAGAESTNGVKLTVF